MGGRIGRSAAPRARMVLFFEERAIGKPSVGSEQTTRNQ